MIKLLLWSGCTLQFDLGLHCSLIWDQTGSTLQFDLGLHCSLIWDQLGLHCSLIWVYTAVWSGIKLQCRPRSNCSVDPDQTAVYIQIKGAVWSWSTLFAILPFCLDTSKETWWKSMRIMVRSPNIFKLQCRPRSKKSGNDVIDIGQVVLVSFWLYWPSFSVFAKFGIDMMWTI